MSNGDESRVKKRTTSEALAAAMVEFHGKEPDFDPHVKSAKGAALHRYLQNFPAPAEATIGEAIGPETEALLERRANASGDTDKHTPSR